MATTNPTETTCPCCRARVRLSKDGTIVRHGHRHGRGMGGGGCEAWGYSPELYAALRGLRTFALRGLPRHYSAKLGRWIGG